MFHVYLYNSVRKSVKNYKSEKTFYTLFPSTAALYVSNRLVDENHQVVVLEVLTFNSKQ